MLGQSADVSRHAYDMLVPSLIINNNKTVLQNIPTTASSVGKLAI